MQRNDNDGRVTRFGWKAQNISAMVFSGEAYNVEMGITNEVLTAIQAHRSNANATYPASEANTVIDRFNALSTTARQHMLNFLRSL